MNRTGDEPENNECSVPFGVDREYVIGSLRRVNLTLTMVFVYHSYLTLASSNTWFLSTTLFV